MFHISSRTLLALAVLAAGFWSNGIARQHKTDRAATMALEFLSREVPAWSKINGCFSCHNNGDGARALYAAIRKGYSVAPEALKDTTAWVGRPGRWEENKGDAVFSDKRLADIQFAASLLAAFEAGKLKDRLPLQEAARKLAAGQSADGAWRIDPGNTPGSPATYGTPLATYMALRTLKQADASETRDAVRRAEHWLEQVSPDSVLTASVLLLASSLGPNEPLRLKRKECLNLLRAAQTRDGGWGPYSDSPAESFDTAVALIALSQLRNESGIGDVIRRGRDFLVSQQNRDGSWPETTRPPGGESYAQRLSTSGWATLALLETKE